LGLHRCHATLGVFVVEPKERLIGRLTGRNIAPLFLSERSRSEFAKALLA
jgi:hypothetical protein